MHFILSFDINQVALPSEEVCDKMVKTIEKYKKVMPVKNTFIISIDSQDDWHNIFNDLVITTKEIKVNHAQDVQFIMSPD
jgi:hypothetical protein